MIFNRPLIKQNAKYCLKRFYWTAFAATLIVTIVGGIAGGSSSLLNLNFTITSNEFGAISNIIPTFAISTLIALAISLFVIYPLNVGLSHFFLRSREDESRIDYIGYAYKNCLGTTIGTMLCMNIYIVLWILLAYVPMFVGIILYEATGSDGWAALTLLSIPLFYFPIRKAYEYFAIPYILAENSNMTRKRAFQLSKQMTDGYKGSLFVLDLSFIGWVLLCIPVALFTCGLGVIAPLFLYPYIYASRAEAYTFLKANAKAKGYTVDAELPGFAPQQVVYTTPIAAPIAAPQNTVNPPYQSVPTASAPAADVPAANVTATDAPVIEVPSAPTVESPVYTAPEIEIPAAPTIDDTVGDIPETPAE